jgi:hypothetical protein
LVYFVWRRTISCRCFHYGVTEFSWTFTKHQIVNYVSNFVVEILLILKYDLRSVDETMNDSPFYVMWVVGLEVQITTSMSRFPVYISGQFRTLLHDQTSKKGRLSLASNLTANLMVGLTLLIWWRNCYNFAGPCGQTTNVLLTYLSHLVGLWSAVSNAITSKYCINMLLTTGDSELATVISSLCWYNLSQPRSTWLLSRCPVTAFRLQLVKLNVLGKKDPHLVYFLWHVRLLPRVRLWIDWQRQNWLGSLRFKVWYPELISRSVLIFHEGACIASLKAQDLMRKFC